MNDSITYVDVDGHILEPPTMWLDYIEPEYRDGAVQILLDDKGLEYLSIAGATSWFMQGGVLGNIAGIGQDVREHLTPAPSPTKSPCSPAVMIPTNASR